MLIVQIINIIIVKENDIRIIKKYINYIIQWNNITNNINITSFQKAYIKFITKTNVNDAVKRILYNIFK